MLRMRGHVSVSFFRCDVLLLQGKHVGFRHVASHRLQVRKVDFLHRYKF